MEVFLVIYSLMRPPYVAAGPISRDDCVSRKLMAEDYIKLKSDGDLFDAFTFGMTWRCLTREEVDKLKS